MADIVERLRGVYRVAIKDGLGAVGAGEEPDNPNEFVRRFETPPIQHEAADTITTLRAEVERLMAENASLASWQCEFTDGKTGLVASEGGSTYCAMAKREATLRAEVEKFRELLADLLNSAEAQEGFDPHPIRHARAARTPSQEKQ